MKEYLDAREDFIGFVRKELLGPGSEISIPDEEHEILSSDPGQRYSLGILYTKGYVQEFDNNDIEEEKEPDLFDDYEESEEEPQKEEIPDIDKKHNDFFDSDNNLEDGIDEDIRLSSQNKPSSMGFTFFAKGNTEKVNCHFKFATYRRALAPDCILPLYETDINSLSIPYPFSDYVEIDIEHKYLKLKKGGFDSKFISDNKAKVEDKNLLNNFYRLASLLRGYAREPHEVDICLDFSKGKNGYIDSNQNIEGLELKLTGLRRCFNNCYSITIMAVNDHDFSKKAEHFIFQPELTVSTENNEFVITESSFSKDFELLNEEDKTLEMLYRNKKRYGTGLGTAVTWEINSEGKGYIKTDFFPEVEVAGLDFSIPEEYKIDKLALSMKYLSDLDETDKKEKIKKLETIRIAYDSWIKRLKEKSSCLDVKYKESAKQNIQACADVLKRMEEGISILEVDDNAWNSFQLANRAMFMQRAHIRFQQNTSNEDRFPDDEEVSDAVYDIDYFTIDQNKKFADKFEWRLFQIAFLIMSISSIVNEKSDSRELIDLIWFPTGGGKTEAYLGLSAFTIFYRRLVHKNSYGGTTIIMRYTLRLLAAQQFTRASTLICACEYIRVDATSRRPRYGKYDLGDEPITIGLWIGSKHTPNTNEDAKKHFDQLSKAKEMTLKFAKENHNKFQVLKCPWCGTKLVKEVVAGRMKGMWGYRMPSSRFEIFCPQESCFFNGEDKLPIQIVDEELYRNPPTLLFSTVDKFAMMPWKGQVKSFFGVDSDNRPPELIIQDELHLISGPLGTMVGLYETAIDIICKEKGVSPKIVASTATIRRAKEQCASLYNRNVAQFPPQGLDIEDSFFSREAGIDYKSEKFGRKYIGLMGSGRTKITMEIRTIVALNKAVANLQYDENIVDKFWTITNYFNTLRDLGMCSVLVQDIVNDFIRKGEVRTGKNPIKRYVYNFDELTSRITTTDLNETLDRLEKIGYSQENIKNHRYASSTLLATNMISVGIDIARLNVMLLVGQPKLTSEYIQASSRIGRKYPGIAFTMYDSGRSRDRSHFEQFKSYHESFYKFVEPTTATPFSKPARDRGLHAVLIAILRALDSSLSGDKDAENFKKDRYKTLIDKISNQITERGLQINQKVNPLLKDDSNQINQEIEQFFDTWENMTETEDMNFFVYGEKYMFLNPDTGTGRLLKCFNASVKDNAYETLTSMRNVDTQVAGNVLVWEDENGTADSER